MTSESLVLPLSSLSTDHPLSHELASLRAGLEHYQHASHTASLNLQHQALNLSTTLETSRSLASYNSRLEEETRTLRSRSLSHQPYSSSDTQIAEMTLALRRANDRLSSTEAALLERTTEGLQLLAQKAHADGEVLSSRILVDSARKREEEVKARERELLVTLKKAQEDGRMSDLVVREYAHLVRNMEGRTSMSRSASPSTTVLATSSSPSSQTAKSPTREPISPPISPSPTNHGLADNNSTVSSSLESLHTEIRRGLNRVLSESAAETNALHREIQALTSKLESTQSELSTARRIAEEDRAKLAFAMTELEAYKADDRAAAKLVERYMSFSQSQTNLLQSALSTTQQRHASSISTLHAQIASLTSQLSSSRETVDRLRAALDDLTEDISRETFGRRREIALRLKAIVREERIAEELRRWVRKLAERVGRHEDPNLELAVKEAEGILEVLDSHAPSSKETMDDGSLARIILAQQTTDSLIAELQRETDKRMELERARGSTLAASSIPPSSLSPTTQDSPIASLLLDANVVVHQPKPVKVVNALVELPATVEPHLITSPSAETPPTNSTPESPIGPPVAMDSPPPKFPSLVIPTQPSSPIIPSLNLPVEILGGSAPYREPPVETSKTMHDNEAFMPVTESDKSAISPSSSPHLSSRHSTPTPPRVILSISPPVPRSDDIPALLPFSHPAVSTFSPASFKLDIISHTYDKVQRDFRDCHHSLAALKRELVNFSSSSSSTSPSTHATVVDSLRVAVERLDDFNEDVMVEIEIRMADEARVAEGLRTLITLSTLSASNQVSATSSPKQDVSKEDLQRQLEDFVDETKRVQAKDAYKHKLDDLLHDIALIKLALHELSFLTSADDASPQELTTVPAWSRWKNSLVSSSSPMESPHLATLQVLHGPWVPTHTRSTSADKLLSSLDFRIAMPFSLPVIIANPGTIGDGRNSPTLVVSEPHLPRLRSPSSSSRLNGTGLTPPWPGNHAQSPAQSPPPLRPRTISGMGLIGLGTPPSSSRTSFLDRIGSTSSPSFRVMTHVGRSDPRESGEAPEEDSDAETAGSSDGTETEQGTDAGDVTDVE